MSGEVELVVTCQGRLSWLSHVRWGWVGCHVSDGVELVVTCQVGLGWLSRVRWG